MRVSHLPADKHAEQLTTARRDFFERGNVPDGVVDATIVRSWVRCRHFGLQENLLTPGELSLDRHTINTERDRNRILLRHSRSIMEHLYEQIRESGSMVILADASGLLLETVGDPDFVSRADRVALSVGASWDENLRGTNAIGTALAEESAVAVFGPEHFVDRNGFLTCCASPIFDPAGQLIGVLDISGDYRSQQRHTLGLARFSAGVVERRMFEASYAREIIVTFHTREDGLGGPTEGLAAVGATGEVLAVNRQGLALLGRHQRDVVGRDFFVVFETNLATLIDRQRAHPANPVDIVVAGHLFHLRLRGQLPQRSVLRTYNSQGEPLAPQPGSPPEGTGLRSAANPANDLIGLECLDTGDATLATAIHRARRIIGRDIPLLIQGESGVGKELFAKAYHLSSPRRNGPFVALNCASIPETLAESELFGYQGGAFTGARKEGAPGKILQAHGGTLFLDEIGDMPLTLQARLLRVLQERRVTPLGSSRTVDVDIVLISATHRRLRDAVAQGRFREDLYYRINGLTVTLPALRERSDIEALAHTLARQEAGPGLAVSFSPEALAAIRRYPWPGNIRQLSHVIRLAIALLDEGESVIHPHHLPEELLEGAPPCLAHPHPDFPNSATSPATQAAPAGAIPAPPLGRSLEEFSREVALRTLESLGGNVSAAARQLGISRNTLYRKLGRLG